MQYHTIPPPERLRDFVKLFWVLESEKPYTHYAMADVCPELIFHYNGRFDELLDNGRVEKSFTAGVHGQTTLTRKFQIDKGFGIFGVYLYPQAMPLIFGLPAAEVANQMPDLSTLLPSEGGRLEEQMNGAVSTAQRLKIITAFIDRKLAGSHTGQLPVFSSIKRIMDNQGLIKIKQLSAQYFLSERQFERQFKQFAGFSPKLFSRIVRFQSATARYGEQHKSLTDIAYECGYYDQSHFIHDFKMFSGCSPKQYFSGNSQATAWRG